MSHRNNDKRFQVVSPEFENLLLARFEPDGRIVQVRKFGTAMNISGSVQLDGVASKEDLDEVLTAVAYDRHSDVQFTST